MRGISSQRVYELASDGLPSTWGKILQASCNSSTHKFKAFLDAREKPKTPMPNGTTIILIPQGGCSSDWEEPAK
jgi:hypothetical protein